MCRDRERCNALPASRLLLGVEREQEDDAELVAAIPASADAFDAFYRRHVGTVLGFLARRCATPEDVADATAATFVAVLTSCRTFRPDKGSARVWLLSIAANEARRLARRHGRDKELAQRVEARHLLSPDDAQRIAEMMDAKRETHRLVPALSSARPSERRLLALMADEGLSVTEASRALGIGPGAGRLRLARLRSLVRAAAAQDAGPPPLGTLKEERADDAGQ